METEYIAILVALVLGLLILIKIFSKMVKIFLLIGLPLILGLLGYILLGPN